MTLFDELGVDHVIHCGDVGGMPVFDQLAGRPCTFVWGNMDLPDDGLLAYLETIGLAVPNEAPVRLTLDDKRFAVFHGHEYGFERALASLGVDYILHGHTHVARDDRRAAFADRRDGTRIINPGALHRARRKTVATLDTAADELGFHVVPG